jgi:hypothetical protein
MMSDQETDPELIQIQKCSGSKTLYKVWFGSKTNSFGSTILSSIILHAVWSHRYLMSRLSLQGFYLWRHVLSTAPFILWWSNFEILFGPLHRSSPFIRELRCQAIQTEHGPYAAERTQKAVYILKCLCMVLAEASFYVIDIWIRF